MARPRIYEATNNVRKSLHLSLPAAVYDDLAAVAFELEIPLSRFVNLALIENAEAFKALGEIARQAKAGKLGMVELRGPVDQMLAQITAPLNNLK